MRTLTYFPNARLRPYIDRFWSWESDEGETVALPTVLPGTGAEMFFHYRDPFQQIGPNGANRFDASHLFCARRTAVALADAGSLGFIAVRFRAGALHRFIPTPGRDLMDEHPRSQDLWGSAGKRLLSNVTGASSIAERVRFLESFLLAQLECNTADALVGVSAERLYRHCDTLDISRLADGLAIGRRQLERRFQAATGLTLVEFRRVSRFQKAVRTLMLDPAMPLAEAALAQGYYDQSHFTRDFSSLVSQSPLAYLKQARTKSHFYNTSRPSPERIEASLPAT